jgi:hypothetical protein
MLLSLLSSSSLLLLLQTIYFIDKMKPPEKQVVVEMGRKSLAKEIFGHRGPKVKQH